MMTRVASCSCGQLRLTCEGEPARISVCHCFECQRRTGSVFGTQARFSLKQVTIEGSATQWTRLGDSGQPTAFSSCPVCASTVYWEPNGSPGSVVVAVGMFADPSFPPPHVSVYEERQHEWALAAGQLPLQHEF
ncbi:MAG TPA: GFA family protein [Pedomonas sp.]|uniref:GFA family protein n=1 Tax=Pedomonas sp. TaxID=2976421 RepID=UPI002F3F73A8